MRFWTGSGLLAKSRVMPRSLALSYDDLVDQAKLAEDEGFDAVSSSEHHFMYDGFSPSPLLALAAMAAGTTRIKLVTGALLLPLHDPLRVAEEAALLDALSDGRLILGLGMGYRPLEFSGLDAEKRTRGVRLIEEMEVLRSAFSSDTLDHEGRHYRYEGVRLRPRPVQRPIEMWVCGGTTERAARRAGKAGFPYWIANSTFEHVERCVAAYRDAGREAGWQESDLRVAVFRDFCLAGNVPQALELRDVLMQAFYSEHILGYGYLVDESGEHVYDPPADHPLHRQFLDAIFCGTPEMAVDEIRRFEALGVEAMYPATSQRDLFVREVMPHVSSQ